MTKLAIVGGTGLTSLKGLSIDRREVVSTRWGEPSGPILHGTLAGKSAAFLPRHGPGHTIPPHRVNYRANIEALRSVGITDVLAVAAVGGIDVRLAPGTLAVPDQIIDYTWGRKHTLFDEELETVVHVDFTSPYSRNLRELLIGAARDAGVDVFEGGTYGCTQGPRLESKAEIDRMERDGCHIVGMTGMPEAALAREAGLAYAHCAVVVNPAAGRGGDEIIMSEIEVHLKTGMVKVMRLIEAALRRI
ncbi:MAG: S-methyl-5'-thioinosine phosphorylase [Gammaproteobacteria bacterium]